MQKLVIASNNTGKLREIGAILQPLHFETLPQSAFNIPEAEEPHCTFIENCLAKARHASRLSGYPALADDSGICVDALDGAPGVYSAHFAGEPKSDQRNNEKLIKALRGHTVRRDHRHAARRGRLRLRPLFPVCTTKYLTAKRGQPALQTWLVRT